MRDLKFPRKRPGMGARCGNRQHGGIAILMALFLIVMLGFMGLALDMGRLYNRKVELQSVADAAALSAAERLVGTAAGIDAALAAAASAATAKKIGYEKGSIEWRDSAVTFSSAPSGAPWVDAGAARAAAQAVAYVAVDTAALGDAGMVKTLLMLVMSEKGHLDKTTARARAVAGRSGLNIAPLAICAMSKTPAAPRATTLELVQYGFRRGVAYDLMQLNPDATTPANFVINPIDPAAAGAMASNSSPAVVGPFVCTGSMPKVSVMEGQLAVTQPFPLAALYEQLNSRFDQYNGNLCDFRSAPPDANIKSYLHTAPNIWMKSNPGGPTAAPHTSAGKLQTVADPDPHPAGNTAANYGLMWAYARPVLFAEYAAGVAEPEQGYRTIDKLLWPALYAPGLPEAKNSYPSATPYWSGGNGVNQAPSSSHGYGVRHRRVLNIPLLNCPVAPGSNASAEVLAIGRFFMTVPATATSISAEFAGIASEQSLGGTVELFQ